MPIVLLKRILLIGKRDYSNSSGLCMINSFIFKKCLSLVISIALAFWESIAWRASLRGISRLWERSSASMMFSFVTGILTIFETIAIDVKRAVTSS